MYDIKITNKDAGLYIAFKCKTKTEVIHGVTHAMDVLQREEKTKGDSNGI